MTTIKSTMSPELKARWVAALRSGDYNQGSQFMYIEADPDSNIADDRVDHHCCLGVLRHVVNDSNDNPSNYDRFEDPSALPTHAEREDWGLVVEVDGDEDADFVCDLLSAKNDGTRHPTDNHDAEQWSFEQIADWIEANL